MSDAAETPQIPQMFREVWVKFFHATLASRPPIVNTVWDANEIADDAAQIADAALEEYKKRFL